MYIVVAVHVARVSPNYDAPTERVFAALSGHERLDELFRRHTAVRSSRA
jgi:hypothetical protein